ncbi:MAG: PAS domain-containing sensor histidine kinase [Mariniphaga sp.]
MNRYSEETTHRLAEENKFLKEELEKIKAEKKQLEQQLEQIKLENPADGTFADRIVLEEELHRSRTSFELVNKATLDIVWDWDLKTNALHWNEAVEAATGRSRDELSPTIESWHRHIHPQDRPRVVESIQKAIDEGKEFWSMEYRFGPEGGPWKDYFDRGYIARDQQGKAWRMVGTMFNCTDQKKAEEALAYNEKLLQNILQVLPVGIFISDEQGNVVKTNRVAEKIWGGVKYVPIDQLKEYKGWWRKTGKRIKSDEWALARAFQKGETSVNEEIDIECFDGTRKTVLNFAVPVKNQEGKIISAVAVTMDITTRIKMEEALQESEKRFRKVLEIGTVGVLFFDLKGNFLNANDTFLRMIGHSRQALEQGELNSARVTLSEWMPRTQQAFDELKQTGMFSPYEKQLVRPDGTTWWGLFAGTQLSENEAFEFVIDVTERRQTEQALKEQEEKFRLMANNISQLAWMADSQGSVFWYNRRWYYYTGTNPEEIPGWGWQKVLHPDHVGRVIEKISHSFENGQVWEDLFPLRNKEGQYRWFLSRAVPYKDQQGNIVRWFGTHTDITRQREYEERLKSDNELFEELLYITAHDLKGPIANIYMALELINKTPNQDKLKLLGHFGSLVERLETTITGVTDILKVRQANKSASAILYFHEVLDNVLTEFKGQLKPSDLVLNIQKRTIRYVEPFLNSILKNLISNAIKYRRTEVPLKIEITTLQHGEYTLLIVRDNGIGIDLALHGKQLFSPFHRINSSQSKGTGVGLYIIKKIIKQNGGYIETESTPGEGTAFYCYLKEY